MSVAVLKSRPQSIQEPSLHYLHNWVSSVQLLSIQWLRNWVSSPKHCQQHGMKKEREKDGRRENTKWMYLHPLPRLQQVHIYSFKIWQESFCQYAEVLQLSSAGVQSLSPSIITQDLYSPSLNYMQSTDYWTGYKLCYFLHLTKNGLFVARWFEQPSIT